MEKGDIVYLNHPRFGIYKGEYERKAGKTQVVVKITESLKPKGSKIDIGKLQKIGKDFIVKDKPVVEEKKKKVKKEPPTPFNDEKKEKLQQVVGNDIGDSNENPTSSQSLYVGTGGYKFKDLTTAVKNRWKLEIKNPINGNVEKTLYFASLTELASKVPMFKYDTWRNLALGRGKRYDRFVKLSKMGNFQNWNSNKTK